MWFYKYNILLENCGYDILEKVIKFKYLRSYK